MEEMYTPFSILLIMKFVISLHSGYLVTVQSTMPHHHLNPVTLLLENAEHCITVLYKMPIYLGVITMWNKSIATMHSILTIIHLAAKKSNAAQIPIVTKDQPLRPLSKAGWVVLAENAGQWSFCHHTRWPAYRHMLPDDDRRMVITHWVD